MKERREEGRMERGESKKKLRRLKGGEEGGKEGRRDRRKVVRKDI